MPHTPHTPNPTHAVCTSGEPFLSLIPSPGTWWKLLSGLATPLKTWSCCFLFLWDQEHWPFSQAWLPPPRSQSWPVPTLSSLTTAWRLSSYPMQFQVLWPKIKNTSQSSRPRVRQTWLWLCHLLSLWRGQMISLSLCCILRGDSKNIYLYCGNRRWCVCLAQRKLSKIVSDFYCHTAPLLLLLL